MRSRAATVWSRVAAVGLRAGGSGGGEGAGTLGLGRRRQRSRETEGKEDLAKF